MTTLESLTPQQAILLARLVVPVRPQLSAEVATYLSHLRFDEADIDRMNDLAAKARGGELTPEEKRELDDYECIGLMLEQIKSEARQRLKQVAS